jgi:hypothetical protein
MDASEAAPGIADFDQTPIGKARRLLRLSDLYVATLKGLIESLKAKGLPFDHAERVLAISEEERASRLARLGEMLEDAEEPRH